MQGLLIAGDLLHIAPLHNLLIASHMSGTLCMDAENGELS